VFAKPYENVDKQQVQADMPSTGVNRKTSVSLCRRYGWALDWPVLRL